jgi:chain length determinant protein tyrosine kinase EpsG
MNRETSPGSDAVFEHLNPTEGSENRSRAIGELIRDARNLSSEDLERISQFQRANGLRFGEAAIALGLADTEDVLQALAQQFKYAYADDDQRKTSPELVTLNQPFGHQSESFRAIRSQILIRTQAEAGGSRRPLAVVSPNSGDGKTYFVGNLGVALAQLGGKVLLIDADMRGARLHQVFSIDNTIGLSNVLSGRGGKGVVKQVPGISNLFVIPVGIQPPNPLELAEGPAFGLLLREVAVKFDHVVVDTPAMNHGSDGTVIASRCGAALVVARRDVSRVKALRELTETLQGGQTRLVGVVMNEF